MTGFNCSTEIACADSKNYCVSVTERYEGYDDSICYYVNVLSWETAEDIISERYDSKHEAIAAFKKLVKQYAA